MGKNITKAVIANAHTSCAAVASYWTSVASYRTSNSSGAIHGEPPVYPGVDILNEELVRNDRPKSARRALPSSVTNTLSYNKPHQIEPHYGDKQTHPLQISMVQWFGTAAMQVA